MPRHIYMKIVNASINEFRQYISGYENSRSLNSDLIFARSPLVVEQHQSIEYPKIVLIKVDGKDLRKFNNREFFSIEIVLKDIPLSIISGFDIQYRSQPHHFYLETTEPIRAKIISEKTAKSIPPYFQIKIMPRE
ncbi:MAG: hypothetical protein Q6363_010195 [Candidatus Njordarchaeota archaeon]